jgi:hypothetical protein
MAIDPKRLAIALVGVAGGRAAYLFFTGAPITVKSMLFMGPPGKTYGSSSFTPYAPGATRPGPLAPQPTLLDELFKSSAPTSAPVTTPYAPGATKVGPFAPTYAPAPVVTSDSYGMTQQDTTVVDQLKPNTSTSDDEDILVG